MARISYNAATLGGKLVSDGINHIRLAKECFDRAKALADAIFGGGAVTVNLEASTDFGADAGNGQALYTSISNAKSNINIISDAAIAELDKIP